MATPTPSRERRRHNMYFFLQLRRQIDAWMGDETASQLHASGPYCRIFKGANRAIDPPQHPSCLRVAEKVQQFSPIFLLSKTQLKVSVHYYLIKNETITKFEIIFYILTNCTGAII